jgi:hypothetical protein
MPKVIVDEGQNMMDVALQHLGAASAVYDLAFKNGISVTHRITPGQTLELPAPVNAGLVKYFAAEGIVIATEQNETVTERKGGINYMQIGTDFKVS